MKILSPVDYAGEVKSLLEAGADELYGGFVPPEWRDKYSLLGSINKRTFSGAQFDTKGELEEAIGSIHAAGGRFFLTLNNDYYSSGQYPLVLKEVERAIELSIDAILVADLGLILEIKREGYPIDLHLSILTAVLNSEAAMFYRELGLKRIVLERALTTKEIGNIISKVKDCEFEVFVAYGKCPNIEGLCSLFHQDDPDHRWPCSWEYEGSPEAQGEWATTSRGDTCGLCAMYDLSEAGVTSLKIAGRGRLTEHKLRAVKTLFEMRSLIEGGVDREDFYDKAQEKYQEMFGHECNPYVCYCPELRIRGQGSGAKGQGAGIDG